MNAKQIKKLVDQVVLVDIHGDIYNVTKRIVGDGPILIAQKDEDGLITEIEFTEENLKKAELTEDGWIDYNDPENENNSCLFFPLATVNVFTRE